MTDKSPTKKVRFGTIHADHLSFDDALAHMTQLIESKAGGFVVTPNVDHVCLAHGDARLREVYAQAALSLVDGMPLLWLAKALGHPLPQKISGSDLIRPLSALAAKKGWRVYFLGGMPGVAQKAADILQKEYPGLQVAGCDAPPLGFEKDKKQTQELLNRIRIAEPHLILVALGCPKQEYWMADHVRSYNPALAVGIGASLDFVAGIVKRSPAWVSSMGLEWVYRLAQEPRRMASRYLVRDRAIIGIAIKSLFSDKKNRTFYGK
jgi:N-acetylglucosaminyldiphosphoundecaprenol N-acetyl-beta-D-mannosaminyltransferase